MKPKANYKKNNGDKLVDQIDAALVAFRKMNRKKQGDLYVEVQCALNFVRKKQVEAIVNEILDVMHVELYGYSKLHNYQTIKYKRELEEKRLRDAVQKSALRLVAKNDKPVESQSSFAGETTRVFKVINGGKYEN